MVYTDSALVCVPSFVQVSKAISMGEAAQMWEICIFFRWFVQMLIGGAGKGDQIIANPLPPPWGFREQDDLSEDFLTNGFFIKYLHIPQP